MVCHWLIFRQTQESYAIYFFSKMIIALPSRLKHHCSLDTAKIFVRLIREGDTASVIGILKKHHTCDIVDAPAGVVTTGCQLIRCMFPVFVEGLILIGDEDPDEAVYMV